MKFSRYVGWGGLAESHPTRGAWIEISDDPAQLESFSMSHPTRGAWIEIASLVDVLYRCPVAPHTGCVD